MKNFITMCLLLLCCQLASAQHDLYKWQLSGYTGIAHYAHQRNSLTDYLKPDHNLLHRLELTRNLGNGLGLSINYSMGEVKGRDAQLHRFPTDVRMSTLRVYYFTDNGSMFNTSAFVSPYFFGGYGLAILETAYGSTTEESRYVPVVPFGVGLKFRLSERWQLSVQTEAVYQTRSHLQVAALEQNDYNNTFVHTGVTVGYNFGFRKSDFKAAKFYAENVALLQSVEGQSQPKQNVLEAMLKLQPKNPQLPTSSGELPVQPGIEAVETDIPAWPGTTAPTESVPSYDYQIARLVPAASTAEADTTSGSIKTISSAGTIIRRDTLLRQSDLQPLPASVNREIRIDSVGQPQEAAAAQSETQQLERPLQTATPEREVVRRTETVPARAQEPARVQERVIYNQPRERRPVVVRNTGTGSAQLRQQDRQLLTSVNAANKRLQSRLDSLQAAQQFSDTTAVPALDTDMVQYLQQQAALNDSLARRLDQYEQELAQLQSAAEQPVNTEQPMNKESARFSTTVFFPVNAHQVPTQSLRDLNEALTILRQNPGTKAKLTGYTSQSGHKDYNLVLSRKRVASLLNLLADQGIAKERFSTAYMGDEKSSQKENPLDRRVEIVIFEE